MLRKLKWKRKCFFCYCWCDLAVVFFLLQLNH